MATKISLKIPVHEPLSSDELKSLLTALNGSQIVYRYGPQGKNSSKWATGKLAWNTEQAQGEVSLSSLYDGTAPGIPSCGTGGLVEIPHPSCDYYSVLSLPEYLVLFQSAAQKQEQKKTQKAGHLDPLADEKSFHSNDGDEGELLESRQEVDFNRLTQSISKGLVTGLRKHRNGESSSDDEGDKSDDEFVPLRISTWKQYLTGDPKDPLTILTSLRQHFRISCESDVTLQTAFDNLESWIYLANSYDGWYDDTKLRAMGKDALLSLRLATAKSRGINDVNLKKLYRSVTSPKHDKFAKEEAKLLPRSKFTSPPISARRCYNCGGRGHIAKNCSQPKRDRPKNGVGRQ